MALKPKLTDYVSLIMQLFERFMQHRISKQGVNPSKPFTYSTDTFIIFFHVDAVSWHLCFQNPTAMVNPSPGGVGNAWLATPPASHHHCSSV